MNRNYTGATPKPMTDDYVEDQLRRKRRRELLVCWLLVLGMIVGTGIVGSCS